MRFSCDNVERLATALVAVGANAGRAAELHAALTARYEEPHRAYHTMRHIASCLAFLDAYRAEAEHAAEVELALWFHDAIYDPRRFDNEQQSGQLAAQYLGCAGVPESATSRVVGLIQSTAAHGATVGDAALMTSIDLAILGADPADYDVFEGAIRREYAHVPELAYVRGRSAVLAGFLARAVIYACRPMAEVLEARARQNLTRTLALLAQTFSG